jgi:hypothetical protein
VSDEHSRQHHERGKRRCCTPDRIAASAGRGADGGGAVGPVDDPAALAEAGTVAEGNGILGHILGSKDVSRQVAAATGAQTGLGPDVMKRLLPLVATLVMGAMSRQAAAGGASSLPPAGAGGLLEMLGGALDSNRDGSAIDDITGMIGRTFGRS